MRTKIYEAKTLIDGKVIGKPDAYYIAVPETYKGSKICVDYNGQYKIFDDWLKADAYRRFPDKWGRGIYTLAYFKWSDKNQFKTDSL